MKEGGTFISPGDRLSSLSLSKKFRDRKNSLFSRTDSPPSGQGSMRQRRRGVVGGRRAQRVADIFALPDF